MNEELKAELETLVKNVEGKTAKEIKDALVEFEAKSNEAIDAKVKGLVGEELKAVKAELKKESDEAIEAVKEDLKKSQDHLDNLDMKMQSKKSAEKEKESFDVQLKGVFADNFSAISQVRKGNSIKLDVKVVGDMTLGNNLTGDQPRSYSNTVIPVTSPLLNFVDLLGPTINIDGGTYTFPQETGSEGAIAWQTEGAEKGQIDYDLTMVDVTTDFLAGTTTYSKKMSNNLPFLQSFIPMALRRDYVKQENASFNTILAAGALASTEVITGSSEIEMLMNEVARLEQLDNPVTGIVVRPDAWWDIAKHEKSTGSGYGFPEVVSYTNGNLFINGIPVYKATWLAANKYYVGDWSRIRKVVTEGLSLEFSTEHSDNFTKNNITARIESQIGLAIERDTAIIYGDFTATS